LAFLKFVDMVVDLLIIQTNTSNDQAGYHKW